MYKVVPHIVPDPVVPQLHAVAVLRVQEVLVSMAARIATTAHVAAHCHNEGVPVKNDGQKKLPQHSPMLQ